MTGPGAAALQGLKIADLSEGVAGQFAGRILAEHGADVALIEHPAGSPVRRMGPFRRAPGRPPESLLHWHLNSGKRSIALDWSAAGGTQILARLGAACDVLITDRPVDDAALRAASARLVICRIADFAGRGPYAKWKGSEMIHQALSGLMYTTGRKDERPLYGFGYRAYYSAGVAAAVAILGALMERGNAGAGRTIDVTVHETAAAMSQNLVAQFSYNGSFPLRGRYPGACDVFRCSDGWATVYCRGDRWKAWCTSLGAVELAADSRFGDTDAILTNWPEAYRRLSPVIAGLSVDEFVARTDASRALAAKVNTMKDALECAHLAAREFWQRVRTETGERTALGPLFRLERTPRRIGPAPVLGAISTGAEFV